MNTHPTTQVSTPFPHEWIADSLLARRSVAGGAGAHTHYLSEEAQGTYHYTMGPYSDPVLHVKPGDRIVVETRDAFEGAIQSESDKPKDKLRMPFLNPQNGPIMVEGAEKGDALAVYIESMVPRGENPLGTAHDRRVWRSYRYRLYGDPESIRCPRLYAKSTWTKAMFIGATGSHSLQTAYRHSELFAEIDLINSLTPDLTAVIWTCPTWGRARHLSTGTVAGRRLFIGDAHACQGDGEVCGDGGRVSDHNDDQGRSDQRLDDRLATAGDDRTHHGYWQRPPA